MNFSNPAEAEVSKQSRHPYFPFYADDFLAGTIDMAAEEVGAYIRLLCHQWSRGGLPNDQSKLTRIAGGPVPPDVLAKFYPDGNDGLLKNPRMERDRSKLVSKSKACSESGKRGGRPKGSTARIESESKANTKPAETQPEPTRKPRGSQGEATKKPDATETDSQKKGDEKQPELEPNITPLSPKGEASPWIVAFGLELPETLRTPECLEAVQTWLHYKSERREGYKETGLRAALTKWAKEFNADDFPGAVQNSMAQNWKGIFPEKTSSAKPETRLMHFERFPLERELDGLTRELSALKTKRHHEQLENHAAEVQRREARIAEVKSLLR